MDDERLPFKVGDRVLVWAEVTDFWRGPLRDDRQWVNVAFEGRSDVATVQADQIVRPVTEPEPQDWIDRTFGGPPPGTVEVDYRRWLEVPESKRVLMATWDAKRIESTRYFEVRD